MVLGKAGLGWGKDYLFFYSFFLTHTRCIHTMLLTPIHSLTRTTTPRAPNPTPPQQSQPPSPPPPRARSRTGLSLAPLRQWLRMCSVIGLTLGRPLLMILFCSILFLGVCVYVFWNVVIGYKYRIIINKIDN